MKKSDFLFDLPEKLIAQFPGRRGDSRLMILDRENETLQHKKFSDIVKYIKTGDCIVVNDSKVIKARLYGYRESTDGNVEILLVEKIGKRKWKALIFPGRKAREGDIIIIGDKLKCMIERIEEETGERILAFDSDEILKYGEVPLPPYIKRKPVKEDIYGYQTIFANKEGSIAAPTAGLHFDKQALKKFKVKGIKVVSITLHVGPGTFRPVRSPDIEKHKMESERYEITEEAANLINETVSNGHDIFAVGTTTVRVLESVVDRDGYIKKNKGRTDLFIYPPFEFRIVDHLLTNFHLPGSTLIMLVSAFAGRESIINSYNIAISNNYRFYSYGDAMLIL